MTEKAPIQDASSASKPPPVGSKQTGNPAFRMMGLPNIKFKLPSRNWLIFWTITGSFTSTLLYDRYHKKRAQQKWCTLVSHLAHEPLPSTTLPRRITVFLAAPPGDSIRAAREHFHEYVKPILVAGALDWDVIEGRREGEVRAGLAAKIRRIRKRNGEQSQAESENDSPEDESPEELLHESRRRTGIKEWDGGQGDLILGRHTWKEYVRGLHEGWLGPLHPPKTAVHHPGPDDQPPDTVSSDSLDTNKSDGDTEAEPINQTEPVTPEIAPSKKIKQTPIPPLIEPADYNACPTPLSIDKNMSPSLPIPLPHLLGFFNTPTRLYRFLTRRRLADSTGRSVAALVLASQSRHYNVSEGFASAIDPEDASPSAGNELDGGAIALTKEVWEQDEALKYEEEDWHKSAWKVNDEGDEKERVWQEPMVIDRRVGQRMQQFDLSSDEDENAVQLDAQKRREAAGLVDRIRRTIGWGDHEKKGWEMGLEGSEDE